ncbi:MAG: glycosyl hydrolase family 18 protein, partial [Defluviitaleaceae bacterium]|nr:glycosyl hydrolase family 18 protein [Defluviitaleaceae bacterium]
ADYICDMAYDEHTSGDAAGPVASLKYVENGIIATLEEVPKEKLILGLPYYVRVWKEKIVDGQLVTTIQNMSMQAAHDLFKQNGVSFDWNAAIGSYYGEFSQDEDGTAVTYKVWLEDARSIEEKLKLFQKYDLAGVAGWSRNWLQDDSVWALLREYVS